MIPKVTTGIGDMGFKFCDEYFFLEQPFARDINSTNSPCLTSVLVGNIYDVNAKNVCIHMHMHVHACIHEFLSVCARAYAWVYEHLTHVGACMHTCVCACMRMCSFGNTPLPLNIEVNPAGLPSPHIKKLPTSMIYTLLKSIRA